jgi:hypothetical protein
VTDVRPLPVYPYPLAPGQETALRAAIASLGLPYLIEPVPSVPGSPGRSLGLGAVPPHVCECVVVGADNTENPERVAAALRHLMTAPPGAERLVTHEMWLSAVMGMDVKFLYDMAYDPEFEDPARLDPSHDDFRRMAHEGRQGVRFQ